MRRYSNRILGNLVVGDLLAVCVSLWLADRLRFLLPFGAPLGEELSTFLNLYLYFILPVAWFLLAARWQLYDLQRKRLVQELGDLLSASAIFNLALAGALYLTFREVSRLLFVYFVALQTASMSLLRFFVHVSFYLPQREEGSQWEILIVGSGDEAFQVHRAFQTHGSRLGRLAGYVTVNGSNVSAIQDELECLGTLEDIARIIQRHDIDEVIVALPSPHLSRVVVELYQQSLPIEIRAVPDFMEVVASRASFEVLEGVPLIGIREPAISGTDWVLKRSFDLGFGTFLLILFSPFMFIVSVLIWLESPGAPIFRQKRVGENGKIFWIYKFRTMVEEAESLLESRVRRTGAGKILFKDPDDPRITRVGRFLRQTSLDELPQLFNVLKGEMSLVGPRPEQIFIVREYEPWQYQRLSVPPGMTGWWQVTRREMPMHMCTEQDIFYIFNYSFVLDLKILFLTMWVVLNRRGAH